MLHSLHFSHSCRRLIYCLFDHTLRSNGLASAMFTKDRSLQRIPSRWLAFHRYTVGIVSMYTSSSLDFVCSAYLQGFGQNLITAGPIVSILPDEHHGFRQLFGNSLRKNALEFFI